MTLQLKEGGYYRTRDGRKVGPMTRQKEGMGWERPWKWTTDREGYGNGSTLWRDDGTHAANGGLHERDIIAEWTDEPEAQPETGTLAELNVKPGDVVALVDAYGAQSRPMKVNRIPPMDDTSFPDHWDVGDGYYTDQYQFRIVSRASHPDTPKLWRDMTPEEKGALLLAHHEGKVIEWTRYPGDTDFRQDSACGGRPVWDDRHAYRVRPEPKRETVTSYWCPKWGMRLGNPVHDTTHRIAFDLIDGEPDCASIRMEEL